MGIEYEIKFRATRDVQKEILAAVPGEDRYFSMQTTYYDTPSGQLSRRYYTLRRRMENESSICTLKAPAQVGRGEWEVACQRIEDAISALCKLGAPADLPQLVSEGLIAVCGARFQRIARTVLLEDCTVELAIDEGVLTGGDRELPLCEVEIELKEGSMEACNRFAQELATQFALESEARSKFRRALALYKGE